MIKFTTEQNKKLTLWAFARLRDVLATDEYDGDMWFTMDDTIPELKGKVDLNLHDTGRGAVRGTLYEVVTGEDGQRRRWSTTHQIRFMCQRRHHAPFS
jgi:hypothetical protein